MKAGWEVKTLNEVCIVERGSSPRPIKDFFTDSPDGVNWIKIGDTEQGGKYVYSTAQKITPEGAKQSRYVKEGDFILTNSMSFGRPYIMKTDGYIHDGWFVLRLGNCINADYFYHLLSSCFVQDQFTQLASGAIVKNISGDLVKKAVLPIPPLPEQQRIVAILDAAFTSIATAKANTEQNLKNARALFDSYLHEVFSQRGDGYIEKRLDEVCAITSKLIDPRKEEFLDLIHVGAGNITSQLGSFIQLKTAGEEKLISGKFLFDESMVLYSKIRPYLMKVARPEFKGLCSADMYPLAPIENQITRNYLFHLLLSKQFTDYAIQGSARAGMPKVNREHLFAYKVWLPEPKQQEELATKLDNLHIETQRLEAIYQRKLTALDELKKTLLHQAFNGEL